MARLMLKLRRKSFNEDDQKELEKLSARFLYASIAMNYTDGYSLKD